MNLKRTFLTVVAAAAFVAVGMYPVILTDWFSQTFVGLENGTAFSGKEGAKGGSWETNVASVATVATIGGRKCISVNTAGTERNSIQFNSDGPATSSTVRIDFSVSTAPLGRTPGLSERDWAALCLLSTNQTGVRVFGGYAKGGWKELYGRGLSERSCEWLDCRAEFEYATNAQGRVESAHVTYYSRAAGSTYVPLADKDGTSRFEMATNIIGAIAFSGTGYIGDFKGYGMEPDLSRVCVWQGPTGSDIRWENSANWVGGKVPGNGDLAQVASGKSIAYDKYTLTLWEASTISIVSNVSMRIGPCGAGVGNVEISCEDGDYTSLGMVYVDAGSILQASGTYSGIDMAFGSKLVVKDATGLLISDWPIFLDGVTLAVSDTPAGKEAALVVSAPYGSGGVLAKLEIWESGWWDEWHDCLDGRANLWIVNDLYSIETATWRNGVWGNLVYEQNWDRKPGSTLSARMANGQAHMNVGDAFSFARWFEIGQAGTGEVDMSGGAVGSENGAVVVGSDGGAGLLDIVGGSVRSYDYLWRYALTLGLGTNSMGEVTVRGGTVDAAGGGVSVGMDSAASLEIENGRILAGDAFGVGYSSTLGMVGGSLAVSNSLYIGRAARGEAYDVKMTVSDGTVSNLAAGAIWVGSFGGLGSKASLALKGGEVYATNRFVCGGYRGAQVDVDGGTLVAPEICVGFDLADEWDVASFNLLSGRVETAGFTSGTNGVRTVTLAGGELVATAANDDFFAGIETVRLEGDTVLSNEVDIKIRSALTGPGGFVKTGAGTNTICGYAAWNGKTVVEDGVLDMDDGIVMGELVVKGSGQVINAKYDNLDALSFSVVPWQSGTASTSLYVRIQFSVANGSERIATVVDANGVTKGAFKRTDGGFAGWTALGWVDLCYADGADIAVDGDVRMMFDFRGSKYYVVYQALRNGVWERLVSPDGLNMFPVPGGAANVKDFTGDMVLGEQLTVLPGTVFYWIGGDGAWIDGANWSGGTCPTKAATAFIEKPVTVSLGGQCDVASLVVNANVAFANGELRVWRVASGVGKLLLAGAKVTGAGADVNMSVPVEVSSNAENELCGDGLAVTGPLSGSGSLSAQAKFYGDMSAFSGTCNLLDGGIFSAEAADNALSSWEITGFPFAVGNLEYEFGALNGSFDPGTDAGVTNVTLVVGARNEDCELQGRWSEDSGSGLDWAAETATMSYSVANTAFLRLSGGGRVLLASTNETEAVPGVISFVGKGGVLSLGSGVHADVSGAFADSSAPIAFDDGGKDRRWENVLDQSNMGGFIKRGKGTLVLAQPPAYAGETVVEEGTLVVPFGTKLSSVRIDYGARLVVDMDMKGATNGIAFAAISANRELKEPYFSVTNSAVEFRTEVGKNNGVILYVGSETFVWTGAINSWWQEVGNWNMSDGQPAKGLPNEQDVVLFENASAVELRADVSVRRVEGFGDLRILGSVGSSRRMSVVGALELPSHRLTLVDSVTLDVAEANIRTLAGTGTVSVAKGLGVLTVAPEEGVSDFFSGTLNVTNFTKNAQGSFAYEPRSAFVGTLSVAEGVMLLDCRGSMTNQPSADVTMKAGATLDLCGQSVLVRSFVGAGTVMNGSLTTADGVVTQKGGDLTVPATPRTTYVLSHAGEHLKVMDAVGKDVTIAVPKSWYVAGVSGRRAVWCEDKNVAWKPDPERVNVFKAIDEGDGWWSIAGGGFAIRLR